MDIQPKRKVRCFLCRTSNKCIQIIPLFSSNYRRFDGTKNGDEKQTCWAKSCFESLCRIISIPERHPCRQFLSAGNYCPDCIQLIRDVDFTLKSLDRFQQQIIGFRDDFVTKLKHNYEAIPNPDSIDFDHSYYESIEKAKISNKVTFGYDEVIQITFKKIEEESFRWTGTDFMKGTTFKNSYDLNACSRNAWEESRKKLESIVLGACIVPQKRTEIKCEYDDNPDTDEDGNFNSGKAIKDSENPDPIVFEETHEYNSNDPDWVASDEESLKSFCDAPENDVSDKRKKNKISSTINKSGILKVPTVVQKFPCPEENCDSYLDTEYALKIHKLKVHEGDPKPYHCDRCELRFKYDASLIAHRRTHGIYAKCLICGEKLASTRLQYHMKTKHNISKPECQYCGAEFDKEQEHLEHENMHRNSATPFQCLICESLFTNSFDLKRHMMSHSDSTCICDICGMLFGSNINMKRHRKYHDPSIVDNKCTECGHVCRNKSHLARHMISHSSEKRIVCETCGKSFKFPGSFTLHNRKHLGERPFSCKVCGKSFTTSSCLKRHEQIHSGVYAYECSGCGKKFVTQKYLEQHEDRCSKNEKSKSEASRKRVAARSRKKALASSIAEGDTSKPKATRGNRSRVKRKRKLSSPPPSELEDESFSSYPNNKDQPVSHDLYTAVLSIVM